MMERCSPYGSLEVGGVRERGEQPREVAGEVREGETEEEERRKDKTRGQRG